MHGIVDTWEGHVTTLYLLVGWEYKNVRGLNPGVGGNTLLTF